MGWLPLRPHLAYAAAVVLPLLVALAFGHPARRVIVPYAIMLTIIVLLTLYAGVAAGLLAVASSTLSLWLFNFPHSSQATATPSGGFPAAPQLDTRTRTGPRPGLRTNRVAAPRPRIALSGSRAEC